MIPIAEMLPGMPSLLWTLVKQAGDSNDNPAYSTLGSLLAIGYITGLREAVYGKKPLA